MEMSLVLTTAGDRGCGSRTPGSLYLSLGAGDGIPWHEFLVDPPTPYYGLKFQGVFEAPPEVRGDMDADNVLLLDMVSEREYTVATFVEETRRLGLSRKISPTFDFSQFGRKRVWLGLIHWKAVITYKDRTKLPDATFRYCKKQDDMMHQAECIFNQWMQVHRLLGNRKVKIDGKRVPSVYTDHNGQTAIRMPSFDFSPANVLGALLPDREFPEPSSYGPGIFAIYPVSHIEAVGYVPMTADFDDSELPVVVVEE
jgi:hypothetical protein